MGEDPQEGGKKKEERGSGAWERQDVTECVWNKVIDGIGAAKPREKRVEEERNQQEHRICFLKLYKYTHPDFFFSPFFLHSGRKQI